MSNLKEEAFIILRRFSHESRYLNRPFFDYSSQNDISSILNVHLPKNYKSRYNSKIKKITIFKIDQR